MTVVQEGRRAILLQRTLDLATWTSPLVLDAGEDAVWGWPVGGTGSDVAVAYYVNDPVAPETVPGLLGEEATPAWFVDVTTARYSGGAGRVLDTVRVTPEPVTTGDICSSGSGCTQESWRFKDYFQAAALPDGGPGIVHDRLQDDALQVVFTRS